MSTSSTTPVGLTPTDSAITHHINELIKLHRSREAEGDSPKRYAMYPILEEKANEFYQRQENTHWSESELDFTADYAFYQRATPQVRKILDTILAFFLSGDGAISENIVLRFMLEAGSFEEKGMFISQLHIELIHAHTYGLAALTFKKDPLSLADLISSIEGTPCVQAKMAFMEKWMVQDRPRYQRLVAFACAEGIFFCTLFAVIFWFRSKGWFPNFILANELIAADESLHRDWGAYLYRKEVSRLLELHPGCSEEIKTATLQIVQEAIAIEDSFVQYILDDSLEDLNALDMQDYARLIADNLLVQLSYGAHYKTKNPFSWANDISLQQKGNFYEVRIGAYQKKSLKEILDWQKRAGLRTNETDAFARPEEIDF